jgi:hypothetical protein
VATGELTEQVAGGLEGAAKATRELNLSGLGYFSGGLGVGLVVGFYFGRRWNREKIRAEAYKESQEAVEEIRQFYREREGKTATTKVVVAPTTPKPSLDEVVEERGYSTTSTEVPERPTRPPVPVQDPAIRYPKEHFIKPGIAKRHEEREKDKYEGWNYAEELAQRDPTLPYVIHQDEFSNREREYDQVTYTYYAADGVLTDEDEDKIEHPDVIVGLENLQKFGHGTDDFHVLYVRNERLELDFEVCLVPQSYEEVVRGLSSDGES